VVPVRLSGGPNRRSGRVEIYTREWGNVCKDFWTTGSSIVVCRQLGLGNTGTFANHGTGSSINPINLDDVRCDGSEVNILACPHRGLGKHNCGHERDVGVTCSGLYGQCFNMLVAMYTYSRHTY